jgi:hypothetical protein
METDIGGGKFGEKKKPVTHEGGWQALWADGEAEADDLGNTLKEVLQPETFTFTNIVHKLSEAAAIHRKILTERHVSLKLGISFERFLTHGEHEVSADVRNQVYCFQFLEEYKYREFLGKFFEWRSPISLSIEIAHPNPHAHPSELLCCCVLLLQSNVRRFVLDESFFKVGRVAGAAKTVDVDRQIIYNSSRR